MQVITKSYNVYSFDELSETSKEKAINNYMGDESYFWGDDALKSLSKLADKLNLSLNNYSIDWLEKYRCSYSISGEDEMPEEDLKEIIESLGEYDKNTLKGLGDCVLTGYCADEDAIDGLRKAYFKGERNIKELFDAAFQTWYKAANEDYEQQFTKEYFSEFANANDYQFTEDGELF